MNPCLQELPDFIEPLLHASGRVRPCYLNTAAAESGSKLPIQLADGPRCQVDRLPLCTFLQLKSDDHFTGLSLAESAHSRFHLDGTPPVDRQRAPAAHECRFLHALPARLSGA